jgi:hypothetical protein
VYFSEAFSVIRSELDDWFDPLLEVDTQLFVDPFLLFAEESGFWQDSGDRMAAHFQNGFEVLAGHQDSLGSLQYKKTVQLMLFPEPREFGLGFVGKGTGGAGTALGFAKRIVEAMAFAIRRGLVNLDHFEELGLLVDRIGRDRISDITCNILKYKFIEYTQEICQRHGIETFEFKVPHGRFDTVRNRWDSAKVELPKNPENGRFILLTPSRFLRELPTLNAADWWNYVEPTLRDDLSLDIGSRLSKKKIIEIARQNIDLIRSWSEARESQAPDPYDVERDPVGLHNWQLVTRERSSIMPIEMPPITAQNLSDFIAKVNESFIHYVEEEGGWRLLRNDDTGLPKTELSIQLLYKGIVQSYCQAHGVRLDREVELGRGPVDFVFNSTSERVLLEVKKMRNGKFWNGLDDQLTSYLTSDNGIEGWLLAIRLTDSKTEKTRTTELPARTKLASKNSGFKLHSQWVDARPKMSASELGVGDGSRPSDDFDPEFPEE